MSSRMHIFRAKAVSDGEWVYGDLIHYTHPHCEKVCIRSVEWPQIEYDVEEDTVGEFTGIRDRSGVEIYEDDIVLCHGHHYIVKWSQEFSGFVYQQVNGRQWYHLTIRDFLGVVGNIHDNNDLEFGIGE